MKKRNGTPSFINKNRHQEIHYPRMKKNISIETNKLILPILKDKVDENIIKNNLIHKMASSKRNRKKRLSMDSIFKNKLSPINTELNKKKKKISKEKNIVSNELFSPKVKSTNELIRIKENCYDILKEKQSKNKSCFNKNNKNKYINNINTEHLPLLDNNNTKIKFPLIETNLFPLKNEKKSSTKNINNLHNKNKLDILTFEFHPHTKKFATFSKKGTEEGGKLKENNQDASVILTNVCQVEDYHIFGIMDGHGSNGHLVSNFVKEKVEEYFNDNKIYKKKKLIKAISSTEISNSDKIYEKLKSNNYEIIREFYKNVNDDLYNTKFDVHFSGTTCVIVFKIGEKIICSNVGDSRAVLVKKKTNLNPMDLNYEFIELSHDHKPENKEEKERIEKLGGEIAQEYLIGKDEPTGPFRVWNKGCDYPGIAISRSIGDKIAELIGVISDPDIIECNIDCNSKYIIMGSDGLFDYLPNSSIMNIAEPYLFQNDPDKACFEVVEKASQLFKEKEERIDDITINIIIL